MNKILKYSLFVSISITAHALFGQSDSTTDEMPLGADFISLVTVGDTNNPPNAVSGLGSVSTVYQIGEYDVTASQYCAFLNHVAASDPYGLYNPKMGGLVTNTSTANITPPPSPFYHPVDTNAADPAVACIQRYGATDGLYSYKTIPGRENFPITYVSIFSAVRFCNWMANGQPTGPEGPSTTELGSYIIGNGIQMAQNPTWILPDLDMWYKAAYYNRNNGSYWYYPTASNLAPGNSLDPTMPNNANYSVNNLFATTNTPLLTPVGTFQASPGPYRTYDMGGDVCQWVVLLNQQQYITAPIAMGCAWNSSALGITFDNTPNPLEDASTADNRTGFRVVYLPKPVPPSYWDKTKYEFRANPVGMGVNTGMTAGFVQVVPYGLQALFTPSAGKAARETAFTTQRDLAILRAQIKQVLDNEGTVTIEELTNVAQKAAATVEPEAVNVITLAGEYVCETLAATWFAPVAPFVIIAGAGIAAYECYKLADPSEGLGAAAGFGTYAVIQTIGKVASWFF